MGAQGQLRACLPERLAGHHDSGRLLPGLHQLLQPTPQWSRDLCPLRLRKSHWVQPPASPRGRRRSSGPESTRGREARPGTLGTPVRPQGIRARVARENSILLAPQRVRAPSSPAEPWLLEPPLPLFACQARVFEEPTPRATVFAATLAAASAKMPARRPVGKSLNLMLLGVRSRLARPIGRVARLPDLPGTAFASDSGEPGRGAGL